LLASPEGNSGRLGRPGADLMASPGKKSFLLRIDPELWAEIERLAAQELRSANAQVEYLLREALGRRGRKLPSDGVERDGGKPQK
jgi:hypothetical protein